MNECPSPDVLERAFTSQLLETVEDSAIVAHVEGCGRCQSWLEDLLAEDFLTLVEQKQLEAGLNRRRFREEKTIAFCTEPFAAHDPAAAALSEEAPLPHVPGYEIHCRIGKGGMGVVYKAQHEQLQRIVALKMILAGEHADAETLGRFHAEAEAVARLRHPNIVKIYDSGVVNGMPYFALEYLSGGSLSKRIGQRPQPPRASAELLAQLAQAVHTAHLAGLVHRDLKPSNVLLAEDGTAKITDFGAVKRCESPGQTQTGQIIGTPAYMAPEQAKGESKSVGPAADVYALGAILYEMVTGRPPFQGKAVMEIMQKVQSDEPVPPRRLVADVPADLETVCLKALRKEPKERYATAQEFADELDRFLHDEPVRARPLSRLEKVCRWVRRYPTRSGLLAATIGLLLTAALAIVLIFDQVQLRREQKRTEQALAAERHAARMERRYLYVNDISLADRLYSENQLFRARQLLGDCAAEQRGWEWHYLDRITRADLLSLTGHTQPVHTLAFAPGMRWLVSGAGDGSLVFWDSEAGRRVLELPVSAGPIRSLAFASDGGRLACAAGASREGGELLVWQLAAGSPPKPCLVLRTSLENRLGRRAAVAYHPNKPLLAVASGMRTGQPGCLLLLDAKGETVRRWSGSGEQGCVALAWSADGSRLAASFAPGPQAGAKGEVVLFDPDQPVPLCRFEANGGQATALAFSPDGRSLACGGADRLIELRDAETCTLRKMCCGHTGAVTSLAFTRGGQLVSGSQDTTVRIWDRHSGQELFVRRGHYGPVRAVAIQPETGLIFSGSDDITIKAWQAKKPQEAEVYRLHHGAASALAFSPDGTALLSVGQDGAVWRIDPTGEQRPRRLLQAPQPLRQVCFLPQSSTVLVAGGKEKADGDGGVIHLLDVCEGRLSGKLDTQLALVSSLSVSCDGRRLAVVGRTPQHDSVVQIWDMTAHPPRYDVIPPELLPGTPAAAKLYSGGDKLLILLTQVDNFLNPSYVFLELSDRPRLLAGTRYAINGPGFAAFNKEESLLLLGGQDQCFNKYQVNPYGLFKLARCSGHAGAIRNGTLSPDERLFATASEDESIRLWDQQTDRGLLALRGDASPMNDVAFSPVGGFLAAAQASGAVWVWDGRPRSGSAGSTLSPP